METNINASFGDEEVALAFEGSQFGSVTNRK